MKYYKEHYQEYIESTITNDVKDNYQMVEKYLHKGDRILDVGFGSARDMLYFQDKDCPSFQMHQKNNNGRQKQREFKMDQSRFEKRD